jgi:hypothetical protein
MTSDNRTYEENAMRVLEEILEHARINSEQYRVGISRICERHGFNPEEYLKKYDEAVKRNNGGG